MNKDRPQTDNPLPTGSEDEKAAGGDRGLSTSSSRRDEQEALPTGEPDKFDRVKYMRHYMRAYRIRRRLKKMENEDG